MRSANPSVRKLIHFYDDHPKDLIWYLKKYSTQDERELSFENKTRLFLEAASDFFDSDLTIYDFSFIGGALWISLSNKEKASVAGGNMLEADELAYYLHHNPSALAGTLDSIYSLLQRFKENGYLGLERNPDIHVYETRPKKKTS
jgi:hypothetical protein